MRASSLAFACLAVRYSRFAERVASSTSVLAGFSEKGERPAVSGVFSARRILILDPACSSCLDDLRAAGYEVTAEHGLSNSDLERVLETNSYDAVVVRSANQITRSMLVSSPRLAAVGRAGSGVDNIDLVAAAELGVPVVNAPTGNARSVAELVFGLMLGISRSIPEAHATMQRGEWAKSSFNGHTLVGKTLGVIGFGSVGQELARMAIGFGMVVLIAKQSRPSFAGNEDGRAAVASTIGVKGPPLSLDELLSQSDFLSVHVPLTSDTRGLIGEQELVKMKPSAVVINAARGEVVDEQALLAALEKGRLGGAALDVFGKEKAPLEHHIVRLCRLPNVICTPHIGGSTEEAGERVLGEVCNAVVGVLDGTLPPERVVSENACESLRLARARLELPPTTTL